MRKPRARSRRETCVLRDYSGVMYTPVDMVTTQGYDLQFGTNVLGAKRVHVQNEVMTPDMMPHRPFLFHQTPPSRPHSDREKIS